jgi:hypothetical protein
MKIIGNHKATMLNKIPRVYWAAAIIAAIIAFYVFSNLRRGNVRLSKSDSKYGVPYNRFAGAELLRSTKSAELRTEIKKLIEQNGLPADVFVGLSSTVSNEEREKQQENNIALTLHSQFHEYYVPDPENPSQPLRSDLQKLWEASPVGAWDADKATLDKIRVTLAQLEPKRLILRKTLLQPQIRFDYVFVRPTSLKLNQYTGIIVDTGASKYLGDYALLEEYVIAQALLDGNIEAATGALACIFRIAYLASTLDNIGTRIDVAHVRLRAFDVMQRVVIDPKFEKKHLIALRNMLLDERNHWTPEYNTWFGDRASGIMLYHRIMIAGPDAALEPAEIEMLETRGIKGTFARHFGKNWEADAVFYLQTMQKILDVSNLLFVQRLDVLNQIKKELSDKEDRYDDNGILIEPVAARVLLQDVEHFMRLFAQDQSALDRALVLMFRSLGQSGAEDYRDPFTDEPYTVRKVNGLFSVSTEDLPRPFHVPIFTDTE